MSIFQKQPAVSNFFYKNLKDIKEIYLEAKEVIEILRGLFDGKRKTTSYL